MRTNHILILVFTVCLLLVAAGCTGTPGAMPYYRDPAAPTFTGQVDDNLAD